MIANLLIKRTHKKRKKKNKIKEENKKKQIYSDNKNTNAMDDNKSVSYFVLFSITEPKYFVLF